MAAPINTKYTNANAAGHQGILNEFNEAQRTEYLDETIWRHKCESIIPQISDRSWFSKVENLSCTDSIMYKLQPTGVQINSMTAYNQELKSHTPKQTAQTMQFGEWLYSQMKFSKMELEEKCDEEQFMTDIHEAFRREMDDYVEKLALFRMSCISPCWTGGCDISQTGSESAPLHITVDNSHQLPLMAAEQKKTQCDDRGYFMMWPRCEQQVITQNTEVKEVYKGCCTTDIPSLSGKMPDQFGGNTTVIFSDHVPFHKCADGSKVYKLTHAPFGSFGYASILAESETVDSSSMERHWGKIHRMIMRFGMLVPVPWDYTTYYVKFDRTGTQIPLATCS